MPANTYLDDIGTDPDQVALTLEWATYLGDTFGASGALNALRYYERLGWISREVRDQMVRYIRGLSLDEIHSKKYDEPGTHAGPLEELSGSPFGTHSASLQYVAAIADHDLGSSATLAQIAHQRVAREGDVEVRSPMTGETFGAQASSD